MNDPFIAKQGISYYKTGQGLLQNGAAFGKLLNDPFITKRGNSYYKTGQLFYYKTGQVLLQNWAAFEVYYKTGQGLLRNEAAFEVYYITGQLLQNEPLHCQHSKLSTESKFYSSLDRLKKVNQLD